MNLQGNAPTGSTRADPLWVALCAVVTLAAIVAVWPVVNLPFNDDWTYAFTVKRLYETGHLIYNGWSSPSVVGQSYWALLWVRAAGHFSFQVLRISTAPLAVGATVLTYLLARRAGLAAGAAVFAALVLVFTPLFLPLATSFMTDVPACFCLLLSTYAAVRAGESTRRGPVLAWLAVGFAAAAVGGSSRQIVWVAPMAVLPYVAWLQRRAKPLAIAAVLTWVVTLATAVAVQHWFEKQPYSLPEPPISHDLLEVLQRPEKMGGRALAIVLTTVWLTLPAGVVLLRRPRTRAVNIAVSLAGLLIVIVALCNTDKILPPWMGNMLTPTGILGHTLLVGWQPTVVPWPILLMFALGTYVVMAVLMATAFAPLAHPLRAFATVRDYYLSPPAGRTAAQALTLVAGAYLALLITRCALGVAFDRHLLSVIPCVTVPILVLALSRPGGRSAAIPREAWVVLAAIAVYAIAGTQDEFAVARARVQAVELLRSHGVPRTQIDAGLEYNAWTELEAVGRVDVPLVGDPKRDAWELKDLCPHVRPLYRIEYQPQDDSIESRYGRISYFTLMPPFHRQISIDWLGHESVVVTSG